MIIGISSIVRCDYLLKQIPNEYIICFLKNAYKMLIRQKKEESTILKKKLRKELDCNFISSDEDEEDNEDNQDDDDNNVDFPIKDLYFYNNNY